MKKFRNFEKMSKIEKISKKYCKQTYRWTWLLALALILEKTFSIKPTFDTYLLALKFSTCLKNDIFATDWQKIKTSNFGDVLEFFIS